MTFVHIKKLTSLDLSLLTYLKQTNEKASRKESIAKTTLYTFQTESTRKEKKGEKQGWKLISLPLIENIYRASNASRKFDSDSFFSFFSFFISSFVSYGYFIRASREQ